jgi:thiamine kinase-like enzyme
MLRWLQRVSKSIPFALPVLLFSAFLYGLHEPTANTMPSTTSVEDVANELLAEHGLRLQNITTIQSLWAGYGQICRVTATADTSRSVSADMVHSTKAEEIHPHILKLITPPPTRADDEGHTRKILSYQVEQYFYSHLASQLPSSIPVAKCLGSVNRHHADGTSTTAMMLSDLKQHFPIAGEKRNVLSPTQVHAALDWLSEFHGFWWSRVNDIEPSTLVLPPLEEVQHDDQDANQKSVWLNGGYTYLATRMQEYENLASDGDSEWSSALTGAFGSTNKSIAETVATFLASTVSGSTPIQKYQTLIHGDVKSENLFTSRSGEEVAFYDFQYTGIGLGVCDLAKLFTCSVPLSMLVDERSIPHELSMQQGEEALLERYWLKLKNTGQHEYEWETFVLHWETALVDWLRFQASWGSWGHTEWLEARARSILKDIRWKKAMISSMTEVGEM